MDQAAVGQENPAVKVQIKQYKEFIESLVRQKNVLDKKFYVSIPFSSLELGITRSTINPFGKPKSLPFTKDYILERAKMNLYPKRDHLIRQFSRIGLKARQLTTQELIQIFYEWYNPESYGVHLAPAVEYTTAMLQPSFNAPAQPIENTPSPIQTHSPLTPPPTENPPRPGVQVVIETPPAQNPIAPEGLPNT